MKNSFVTDIMVLVLRLENTKKYYHVSIREKPEGDNSIPQQAMLHIR